MTRRRLRSTTARGERIARPTARAKSGGAIRWKRQITTRKALAQKRRVRGAWRCEKGASDANLVSGDRRMRWCTRPLFRRTANEISPAALPRGGYGEMRGFEGGHSPDRTDGAFVKSVEPRKMGCAPQETCKTSAAPHRNRSKLYRQAARLCTPAPGSSARAHRGETRSTAAWRNCASPA